MCVYRLIGTEYLSVIVIDSLSVTSVIVIVLINYRVDS